MDYQDPFQSGLKPSFHQDNQNGPFGRGKLPPEKPPKQKRTLSARLVALCLFCALLGGLGGGFAAQYLDTADSSLYIGDRTPVKLNTIATDTREQMSVPTLYANYVDSCVGITVDIVSTNLFGQPVTSAAAGSGFVITEDGYIMTNYHVIGGASSIKVTFVDGTSYSAKLIGGDMDNDIAVIKINANDLKPVIIGDSSQMYVGESVVTIGNPLGELTFSLSDGVVSALERSITVSAGKAMKMIQTNTTINSGNSGGPLFNLYGEVIGIVSAKYSSPGDAVSGIASVEGLGFAIPISNVKDMITDIIDKGYVTGKPFLGVLVQTVTEDVQGSGVPAGAEMRYVTPGLSAANAGIKEGDVVTAVGGTATADTSKLIEEIGKHKAGDTLKFKIYRGGQTLDVSVKLDEQNSENTKLFEDYVAKQTAEAEKSIQQQQQEKQSGGFGFPIF